MTNNSNSSREELLSGAHSSIAQQFSQGWEKEKQVREWLLTIGYATTDSEREEDLRYDVDCYMGNIPISIKCNGSKYFSHPFCFELEGFSKRTNSWYKSWYYNSKALYTLIWKSHTKFRGELWLLDNALVHSYVDANGFDKYVGLTAEVKAGQQYHNQTDTRCGLLNKKTVEDNGLGRLLDTDVKSGFTKIA